MHSGAQQITVVVIAARRSMIVTFATCNFNDARTGWHGLHPFVRARPPQRLRHRGFAGNQDFGMLRAIVLMAVFTKGLAYDATSFAWADIRTPMLPSSRPAGLTSLLRRGSCLHNRPPFPRCQTAWGVGGGRGYERQTGRHAYRKRVRLIRCCTRWRMYRGSLRLQNWCWRMR